LKRLHADGYLGLYASSMRLLDEIGTRQDALHEPYARLRSRTPAKRCLR
jgi:hypothetical protein